MKVLLVDDDPDLRAVLSEILKAKGLETIPVRRGAEALTRIEQQDIDVALIDIKLEEGSGLEVLRGIKERSPQTECILLTGYASQETAIQAVNLGAFSYFQKPYDIEQLLVSVQRAVEKHQAETTLRASKERYRMLTDNMSDTVWLMDMNLKSIYISPSVTKLRGYTLEEINELPLDQQMTPESLARAMQVFAENLSPERLAQRGQPITATVELEFHKKDGTRFWSENTFTLIRDVDGTPVNILGVGRDITERKLHERELEAEAMVSQALRETEDLQTLLEWILKAARHAIPAAEKGSLALPVDENHLQVRAVNGYQDSSVQGFTFPITWGYAGRAARLRQPLLIANVQADAELQKAAGEASINEVRGLQSAVVVPLLAQETLVGVLSLESTQANAFIEADLGLLANFATFAALILERARLFEDTRQRVTALEMLYESGLALSRLTSPKEIGHKIIELLEQKLDWHHTTIRLFHPETDSLEMLAFNQPGLDSEAERREAEERFQTLVARPGQGLSGWALQHGQSVRAFDLTSDPRYVETYPGLQSGLYVPMKLGELVIGVISIESEKPHAFSEADEQLTTTLATQAAIAFENARLFEEIRQHLVEQDIIHQAGQSLPGTLLNPNLIYTTLHHAAAQIMPCDVFTIVLEDENGGDYHAVYLFDTGQKYPIQRIPRGQGLSGKVISEGKTLFIHDDLQSDVPGIHFGSPLAVRSILAVPLLKGNEAIGMVSTQSYQPHVYGERHRVLLETLAAQAANAIENARLFEETRQRLLELTTIHQISQRLTKLFTLEALSLEIVKVLDETFGYDFAAVLLADEQTGELHLFAISDQGKGEKSHQGDKGYLRDLDVSLGEGVTGWVAHNRQSVRLGDVRNDARYLAVQDGILSELCVPMLSGERVSGVVNIETTRLNAYEESDQRLLETIAAQIAIAVQNARLLAETRRRVTELETINRISITLRAIADRDTMLAVVLEETLHALNISDGSINLWERESGQISQTTARGWLTKLTDVPVKPGEGMFGRVFSSNEYYLSKDFSKDPLTIPEVRPYLPPGWGGACLPIRSTERVLGVLLVSVPEPREFNKDELRLLNTLAEMTGTALHRMSLNEETARRAREFAALYETSTALAAETDLDKLLQVIAEHARDLIHAESSGLYLFDAERGDLEVVLDTASPSAVESRVRFGEGMAGRVAQTRQPMRVEDYSTWEGRSPVYADVPFRAVVEVPLLYHGELIGVLTAEETSDSKRKFSEADERLLALFASQAAGAIHSARLRHEMTRNLKRLQSLRVVDRAIAGSLDRRVTLNILLDQFLSQLHVDAADVLLLNPLNQTLQFAAGQGFRTPLNESASVRVGESFAGRAALERRLVRVEDVQTASENPQFYNFWLYENFSCYYAVPLVAKGQVKGVVEVFTCSPFAPDAEWLNFFETLADQTAIALDNAQLFEHLQSANVELSLAYDATIEGWSRAMELRDEETEGHTQRVTDQAMALARAAGMGEEEIIHLRRGALLHDIGKIGVPDRILLKPGPLTDKEWETMHKHPQYAYEMLHPITYLRRSIDVPYLHHEKWDGSGYPQGLKGEQIPLAARIFALVDVYDALISDRPYRKAWSAKKAIAYIRRQGGKHFDPKLVDIFLELIGDKKD